MKEFQEKNIGYVYILEVADIELPVCKIGMTTRTPYERCDEINCSSTGDFIWSVAHYIAVDDCRKLESLVHTKLAPLRQKKREFFNLSAEDANTALLSIFDKQSEIKRLTLEEIKPLSKEKTGTKKHKKRAFKCADFEYAELLQLFNSLLNVKGRPFGQLNKPYFGISDGHQGVQWNLSVSVDTGIAALGVNLEGLKYKDWPISKFILTELNKRRIFEIIEKIENPSSVFVRFSRDAWQVTSRPNIVEKYLGGQEFMCSALAEGKWEETLREALECLNEKNNFQGRTKQIVTLENPPRNGEQIRLMEVSPHLTIWSPLKLTGNIESHLRNKIEELQPFYDWVKGACE
ncbi:GIY-YIG nuclease family protein [Vibrio neonatus]|uniref:GIY-YIG nuclease family protein n=1 Tax=Vibrio neonatus TaxID=278860 RepID=UPI0021C40023|nr:GIY-YIG nuclease family protein [Vibrio neonatus]